MSTQNDWEKRFDEEFPNLRMHYSDGVAPCEDDVKAFIAKELADARKEGHELGRAESVEFEVDRARKEVIERIDQDIRTTMDPYEYKGKITAQQAKKQTLMMVRQILRATQKEETL